MATSDNVNDNSKVSSKDESSSPLGSYPSSLPGGGQTEFGVGRDGAVGGQYSGGSNGRYSRAFYNYVKVAIGIFLTILAVVAGIWVFHLNELAGPVQVLESEVENLRNEVSNIDSQVEKNMGELIRLNAINENFPR